MLTNAVATADAEYIFENLLSLFLHSILDSEYLIRSQVLNIYTHCIFNTHIRIFNFNIYTHCIQTMKHTQEILSAKTIITS